MCYCVLCVIADRTLETSEAQSRCANGLRVALFLLEREWLR